ncbi:nocturnin-like [Paramormyrops kingsleyae]|uniref:nocturnin-like n=1 Tax=Paramormyrops kingsleyae TaxID=1676925 RepID=UPI003B97A755
MYPSILCSALQRDLPAFHVSALKSPAAHRGDIKTHLRCYPACLDQKRNRNQKRYLLTTAVGASCISASSTIALGEGTDSFIQCPLDALNWAERKYLILEEILTYRPDIVCLQEVDHYFDTFRPIFCSLGYHGTFQPKPRSPCLQVKGNNGPDGCALFFRKERFQLVDAFSLRLVAMRVKTNQVAIVQKLRCRDSGQLLCVAVTHLKARSGCERLRSAQGSHLLHHLRRFTQGTRIPLLVCGDFNAEPGEDVYRRFSSSSLSLASACRLLSADGQAEPPYTTWKIRSSGESCHTLDVWY